MTIVPANAALIYQTSKRWSTGIFSKTYWEADYYVETPAIYRHYIRNLSGTTYWDPAYAAKAGLAVTSTITVGATYSDTVSAVFGIKVKTKIGEASAQIGNDSTIGTTYTKANSVQHSRELDRSSPKGYYGIYAAIDCNKYTAFVYTSPDSSYRTRSYYTDGSFLRFVVTKPYVTLRHEETVF